MVRVLRIVIAIVVMTIFAAAQFTPGAAKTQESEMNSSQAKPTVADAEKFMAETESTTQRVEHKARPRAVGSGHLYHR